MNRIISLLLLLVLTGCNQVPGSTTTFNAAIVDAKLKCQQSFEKWKEAHRRNDDTGFREQGLRAHFNAKLNACILDYTNTNDAGHSEASKVIDIFDGSRVLLEMDIELPGNPTGKAGTYLYENGKEITMVPDVGKEYWRRLAVLFEETPPQ